MVAAGRFKGRVATVCAGLCAMLAPAPGMGQSGPPMEARAAPSPAVRLTDEVRAEIDRIARAFRDESELPALSVAVGTRDGEIWSGTYGVRDLRFDSAAGPEARFRIGSVSKPLTAAAMAILVDRGRLVLDAPVSRYVPEYPQGRGVITVRQLAGHLAGIRHYRSVEEAFSHRHFDSVIASLEVFAQDSLIFEPGTRFGYSTFGWTLLSAVIERAAGVPFVEFVREEVFRAVGMDHTDIATPGASIEGGVVAYERGPNGPVIAPPVDKSYTVAGGGFVSTAEDLVRFAVRHMDGGLVPSSVTESLWTSQRTRSGEETGYGLGWHVTRDSLGRRVVFHGGNGVGGSAALFVYPDQGVTIAFATNLASSRFLSARRGIEALLLGPVAPPGFGSSASPAPRFEPRTPRRKRRRQR